MMRVLFSIVTMSFFIDPVMLQGKWELTLSEAFVKQLQSERFNAETDEMQSKITQTIQSFLDSTFYEFKKDSVYFTDAGPGMVKHKKGIWLTQGDTLIILESGKFKTHKFWIVKQTETEIEMKFVYPSDPNPERANSFIFSKLEESLEEHP